MFYQNSGQISKLESLNFHLMHSFSRSSKRVMFNVLWKWNNNNLGPSAIFDG